MNRCMLAVVILLAVVLRAQTASSSIDADLARIYQQNDFAAERFGCSHHVGLPQESQ